MTSPLHRTPRLAALAALVLAALLGIGMLFPAAASAHSCGDVWCSGNDSWTRYNKQGNEPQIYVGEVGTYLHDINGGTGPCGSGPDGMCFRTGAADGAVSRYQVDTGIGVAFYYFLGGSQSPLKGSRTNYCWGWHQGYLALQDISAHFAKWADWSWMVFADIEDNGTYGWATGHASANLAVLNGFRDKIEGRASGQPNNCSGGISNYYYQEGVYSSPSQWSYSFGSKTIPNTPIWTYAHAGYTWPYPGDFSYNSSEYAAWFGGSSYHAGWQYNIDPDYDIFKEPVALPFMGYSIGD